MDRHEWHISRGSQYERVGEGSLGDGGGWRRSDGDAVEVHEESRLKGGTRWKNDGMTEMVGGKEEVKNWKLKEGRKKERERK